MPNIHELSERTGISLKALRKLERLKVDFGKLDTETAEHPNAAAMRLHLSRNQTLTVAQALLLLEQPEIVADLRRQTDRAKAHIASFGDVANDAAPREVTAYIVEAAKGDKEAVAVLVQWLRSILPTTPVSYQWIALRLLWALPAGLREQNAQAINFALLNARKSPDFAGWTKKDKTGTKFFCPRETFIDL